MPKLRRYVRALIIASALSVFLAPVAASPAGGQTAGRDPVVIVAGTLSPAWVNEVLAGRMRADGYQVWIFELPGGGLQDIALTAQALDGFVEQVRGQTGAARVDLVGHSQGGLVGRYVIKYLGGVNTVDSMISLGAPHYGTSLASLGTFLGFGNCIGIVACQQMSIGSSFLNGLNAGDDTIGSVSYTNVTTLFDEVVVPFWNAHLANDGNNSNVLLQAPCFWRVVGHVGLIFDGAVYSAVQDALAHQPIILNCFAF